jgi:transposase InsO family protein
MPLQGSLSIERMCQLAGVSRAGFYRSLQERSPIEEDMEVRSVIQQIAIEHRRRYGYRRISAELRRRGMLVNHKRVLRIIREDNLLAVQPRAFVVTTDSDHEFEVYLNLASRMKLTPLMEIRSERGFPQRLGKHKTLSTVPTRPDGGSIIGFTFRWAEGWGAPQTSNSKCANFKLSQQRGSPH